MKIINSTVSKRICDHMNKDHLESVHKSLRHYGKIGNFTHAYMEEINNKFMKIKYDENSVIINFINEISEEDVHSTLVAMIKEIE